MSDITTHYTDNIAIITLNRHEKHNAFNDTMLLSLQDAFNKAAVSEDIRAILLTAEGRHFSAGADLEWMQRQIGASENENKADALILANTLYTLHSCPKPTIAVVQGLAMGGAVGLIAASDIAIAATDARFCFSEVKLGLIPAVISPYVVNAIGARTATWLFMSAEMIDSATALRLNLIHHCVEGDHLKNFALNYAKNLNSLAPEAIKMCKQLVKMVDKQPIDEILIDKTAQLIAEKRVSLEGQKGLHAFLTKSTPEWN